mmetsp:Transcript_6045/g.9130  ORF Transcript_6045/g.9130 Transcript_6045/m.9130 type:complete len:288 (+) Transcript_6045:22-885(+)
MSYTAPVETEGMCIHKIHSQDDLASFFLRDSPYIHLYEMGDLDDIFWPHTSWISVSVNQHTQFTVLLYTGSNPPTLVALGSRVEWGERLIRSELFDVSDMPQRFHSHLAEGLVEALHTRLHGYIIESRVPYQRYYLSNADAVWGVDTSAVEPLSPSDHEEVSAFYSLAYPNNWFDPRMLSTGCMLCIRSARRCETTNSNICAIAGVHVCSKRHRVAALGNIAVHPLHRKCGLATSVTAALVQRLIRDDIKYIGLNVASDNLAAVKCYKSLGFSICMEFEEVMWAVAE